MNETRITKLQAAQRQIDAGIWMLFRNDDPVAIHTVAMAALRILRDLVKQRGLEHPVDSMIRPGKENEFWCGVSSFANFFKHADRDPDDISDGFREEVNDAVLLLAAFTYYDSPWLSANRRDGGHYGLVHNTPSKRSFPGCESSDAGPCFGVR